MTIENSEWIYQWSKFEDNSLFLFKEWIYPFKLEDFRGKTALDCGCGQGQHLNFIAHYVKRAVGFDLNTAALAREKNKDNPNIEIIAGDIANFSIEEKYDFVYSIGVIHHTDNPEVSFQSIKTFVKPNGILLIWIYSWEGNFLNRTVLEFFRKKVFLKMNRALLSLIAKIITLFLYLPVYTIYLLPMKILPFYEYFGNFRKLGFKRNLLNVFDKLNAPQTKFIKRGTIEKWFNPDEFDNIYISHYKGVSWRASGRKK